MEFAFRDRPRKTQNNFAKNDHMCRMRSGDDRTAVCFSINIHFKNVSAGALGKRGEQSSYVLRKRFGAANMGVRGGGRDTANPVRLYRDRSNSGDLCESKKLSANGVPRAANTRGAVDFEYNGS